MLNTINTTAYRKNNSPSFKNGLIVKALGAPVLTKGFQFLQANPVAEIVGIDFLTMIAPRTFCDAKQNPVYGVETFFKEAIPIIPNPFLPGIVAGALIAKKGYSGLYANSTTLNGLHQAWKTVDTYKTFPVKEANKPFSLVQRTKQFKHAEKYAEKVLLNTEGQVGTEFKHLREGNQLTKQGKQLARRMAALIVGKNSDKTVSKRIQKIVQKFTSITGAEGNLKVTLGEGYSANANMHFRDVINTGRKLFIKTAPKELEKEVKELGKFSKNRTAQAIATAIIFGSSIQWLINKTSKLLTGKEGFSGYRDFTEKKAESQAAEPKKENKKGLIKGKILATAGMLGMMAATIGAFGKNGFIKNGGLKEFGKRLEIKDRFAHMNVIRLVYGSILISRFWASRETPELKVDVAKNYLGYLNWLVLGPLVSKGLAHALDSSQVNGEAEGKGIKKVFNWFGDVAQRTTNEMKVMVEKGLAKGTLTEEVAKKKMAIHSGSKIAGLAWSMLALGFGVPLVVNKFIIDKSREEQLSKPDDSNLYTASLNKTENQFDLNKISLEKSVLYGSFENKLNSFRKKPANV